MLLRTGTWKQHDRQHECRKSSEEAGVSGVKVEHTAIGEVTEGSADLFVIGADLAPQMTSYKNKIILNQLMDMNEIETKLKEVFGL